MTTFAIVSIVSLLGWLILNVTALRSFGESKGKLPKLAFLWIGIFAGAFALFSLFA